MNSLICTNSRPKIGIKLLELNSSKNRPKISRDYLPSTVLKINQGKSSAQHEGFENIIIIINIINLTFWKCQLFSMPSYSVERLPKGKQSTLGDTLQEWNWSLVDQSP